MLLKKMYQGILAYKLKGPSIFVHSFSQTMARENSILTCKSDQTFWTFLQLGWNPSIYQQANSGVCRKQYTKMYDTKQWDSKVKCLKLFITKLSACTGIRKKRRRRSGTKHKIKNFPVKF